MTKLIKIVLDWLGFIGEQMQNENWFLAFLAIILGATVIVLIEEFIRKITKRKYR